MNRGVIVAVAGLRLGFLFVVALAGTAMSLQAQDARGDGTAAGTVLVRDINPGAADSVSSQPSDAVFFDGAWYFAADDGVRGRELWRSDGTSEGTTLVRDILPGSGSSSPAHLRAANGRLFFTASDGVTAFEPWTSD